MSFNTCRVVSFKLKKQINIDDLLDRETFKIERTFMQGTEIKTDVIDCKITGIKKPRTTPELPRPKYEGSANEVQWVEISGCQ